MANLSPIVVELLQELNADKQRSTGRSTATVGHGKQCDCHIRSLIKEFIRYLRDDDPNPNRRQMGFAKQKARIKKAEEKICIHLMEDDLEKEQNLIMLQFFENFAMEFSNPTQRAKVNKPRVFKRFCDLIMKEQELIPVFQKIKQYIKENNLLSNGQLDYSDFAEHNKFLALKQKKIEKLRGNDLPKINLDDYEDSSDVSGGSSLSDAEEDSRSLSA